MPERRLPPEVAERIGPWYVYLLVHPRTGRPFYVGKGTRERLLTHGMDADKQPEAGEPEKLRRIRELRVRGLEPRIEVVRRGLASEDAALQIEAALIDCLPNLANAVRGHDAGHGREALEELIAQYGATPIAEAPVPAVMIRLAPWRDEHDTQIARRGVGYRPGITDRDLYNGTRAWWNVSAVELERRGIRHFVAVYCGVTRAIYSIRTVIHRPEDRRIGFTGARIVEGPVFDAYVGAYGRRLRFPMGTRNPVFYWPVR